MTTNWLENTINAVRRTGTRCYATRTDCGRTWLLFDSATGMPVLGPFASMHGEWPTRRAAEAHAEAHGYVVERGPR